ncbi:MAG: choice-of-anchor D domain-containing protein [bacterium]
MKTSRLLGIIFFCTLSAILTRESFAQWEIINQLPLSASFRVIYFQDAEKSWGTGFVGGNSLWRTPDRGRNWVQILAAVYQNGTVSDFAFKTDQIGFFSTRNATQGSCAVYKTTDGGLSWKIVLTSPNSAYSGLYYHKKSSKLFLSDIYGTLQVSTDDGASWSFLAPVGHTGYSFLDDNNGICTTNGGSLLITSDGGTTWTPTSETHEAWQPLMLSGISLMFSDQSGELRESRDSGKTWTLVNSALTILQNTGQIGGRNARLYYQSKANGFYASIDSGHRWIPICGPNGLPETRFYVQNDSVYATADNRIWLYPSLGGIKTQAVHFTTNSVAAQQCSADQINLSVHTPDCGSVLILSATLSNTSVFSINPNYIFPVNPQYDTTMKNFVLFKPLASGLDTAYLTLHCSVPGANGNGAFDTIIQVIGTTKIRDTIITKILPPEITFTKSTVCKQLDSAIILTSLCGDYNLESVTLSDSSFVHLTVIPKLPRTIFEQGKDTIRFRLLPLNEKKTAYTTILKLRLKKNSYILDTTILITIKSTAFDPNIFPKITLFQKQVCKSLDTLIQFVNPLCDTIKILSYSFSDSSLFTFGLPPLLTMAPGSSWSQEIAFGLDTSGFFQNSIVVRFKYRGSNYTTTIPIEVTVPKRKPTLQYVPNSISFGTINICKTKSVPIKILNDGCIDLTISQIDWLIQKPDISVDPPPSLPLVVRAGSSQTLMLKFVPTSAGFVVAQLHIRMTFDSVNYDTVIRVVGTANATAVCSFTDPKIEFDTVTTCASLTKSVYLVNDNCDSISVKEYWALSQSSFIKTEPQLPAELGSGDSLRVTFTYKPKKLGRIFDSLQLVGETKGGVKQVQTVVLTGYGEPGEGIISVVPSPIDFKSLALCSHDSITATLTNVGCDVLKIDDAQIVGDPEFTLSGLLTGKTLAPNDSLNFTIHLDPTLKGARHGSLLLFSQGVWDSIPISADIVSGTRLLSSKDTILDFGSRSICDNSLDSTVTVHNSGCDTLIITGLNFLGKGFGSSTKFPLFIAAGKDAFIDIFTMLDTAGGKTVSRDTITFTSNTDLSSGPSPKIILSQNFTVSAKQDVAFYLDALIKNGKNGDVVNYDIKESATKRVSGTGTRKLIFDLNFNSNLLTFDPTKSSSNVTAVGNRFTLADNTALTANPAGVLANIAFNVTLSSDSVTTLQMQPRSDTIFGACGNVISSSIPSTAEFHYTFSCGEQTIAGFMNGVRPTSIVSLRPNPAQDEIIIGILRSESTLANNSESLLHYSIFDALGEQVLSADALVHSGLNEIRVNTRSLPGGMYHLRIGAEAIHSSQNFLKLR